jgi:hypothetical protein
MGAQGRNIKNQYLLWMRTDIHYGRTGQEHQEPISIMDLKTLEGSATSQH